MAGGVKYNKHATLPGGWTEWIPGAINHKIACCDCGLVHDFQFAKHGKVIYFRARRNNRSTALKRRKEHDMVPRE